MASEGARRFESSCCRLKRGERMSEYGSLEYAMECLEGYKKYNSVIVDKYF